MVQGRKPLRLPTLANFVSRILFLLGELELVLPVSLPRYLVVELPDATFVVLERFRMMRGRTVSTALKANTATLEPRSAVFAIRLWGLLDFRKV